MESSGSRHRSALILVLIGLAFVSTPPRSQGMGTYAFESLRRPATIQETSWGGLEGAAVPGPEALRANPAGLGGGAATSLSLSHQSWVTGLQQQWAGWVAPAGPGSLGLEVAATHAGAMDAYDADGISLGTFRPIEGIAGIGYGVHLSDAIRIGGSAHALYLSSPGDPLTGWSSSLGIESEMLGGNVGLSVRNLGPDLKGDQGSYRLPAEAALGLTRGIGRTACLSVTGTLDRDRSFGMSGGARWTASSALALLAGMAYGPNGSGSSIRPGAGIEISVGSLGIAYACAPGIDGAVTQHFSVSFTGHAQASHVDAPNRRSLQSTWVVWGGTHRTLDGAQAEVRALEMQHVRGATVIAESDGNFRVQIAAHLAEKDARDLAHLLNAEATPD